MSVSAGWDDWSAADVGDIVVEAVGVDEVGAADMGGRGEAALAWGVKGSSSESSSQPISSTLEREAPLMVRWR